MKTHRNIPFFVPHAGCPHCCAFCSQVKITGQKAEKSLETELAELRLLLEGAGGSHGSESRIAFFGGSFTAIERKRMEALLSVAYEYVQKDVASGIRISTRPDCINEEILSVLKKYGVKEIELGVQSTNDRVLDLNGRGHTAEDSFAAAKLINAYGFTLGGQMMVGLAGADYESELQTARDIVAMGAKEARIYPTVVFENTKLLEMTLAGEYEPLTDEEAVSRAAGCGRIFAENGLTLLRIGLHSSENLAEAPFGANHPAIGELVMGRMCSETVCELAGDCRGKLLEIFIRGEDISMLTGFDKKELKNIFARTGAGAIKLTPAKRTRFFPTVKVRRF